MSLFERVTSRLRRAQTVTGTADISPCGRYRWTLGRVWDEALPTALWIMLNPSTADHERDDPTMLRVMHFSRSWGYGSATVVNLFPLRTSSPAECRAWLDGDSQEAVDRRLENMLVIERAASGAGVIVVAWGATPWAQADGDELATRFHLNSRDLLCLGMTADGSPKHPLARGVHRVPNNQQAVPWRG